MGLSADLEAQFGGVVSFLEGASGSTHNLALKAVEAKERIQKAVADALASLRNLLADNAVIKQ